MTELTASPLLPYLPRSKSNFVYRQIDHQNFKFYTVSIKPVIESKGRVLFIHGWCEHTGMYLRIMEFLAAAGFECVAFDQRGSGKTSLGKYRGRVGRSKNVVYKDIDFIMEQYWFDFEEKDQARDVSLIGHLMGGGIALGYALNGKYRHRLSHIATTGPLIQVHESLQVNPWVLFFLAFIVSWFPNLVYLTCNGPTTVTSSKIWKEYIMSETLCAGTGTLAQLSNMISRGNELFNGDLSTFAPDISLLILHAENDDYTSSKALKKFFDRVNVKDKEYMLIEGAQHSLFIESDEIFNKVGEKLVDFLTN